MNYFDYNMYNNDLHKQIQHWKTRYELAKRAYQLRQQMPNYPVYFSEEMELMCTSENYE